MKIVDYDEVYATLAERNMENICRLMGDLENDLLLGEDAFSLSCLKVQKGKISTGANLQEDKEKHRSKTNMKYLNMGGVI